MEHFGKRLKNFRGARGWSQERLGFELNVSKATVSKWENGQAQPSLQHLSGIRRIFAPDGLTLDYLIDGAEQSMALAASADLVAAVPDKGDEAVLLKRFRALSAARRRGLLDFMAE